MRQLLRAHALGQHVEGQLANVGSRLLQGFDIARAVDGLANLAQADALQREQVALGYDAGQPAFGISHQDVANAVRRHGEHRIVGGGMLLEHEGIGRHRLANRRGQRQLGKHNAVEQVGAGKDADRLAILASDYQRTNTGLRHGFRAPHGELCAASR